MATKKISQLEAITEAEDSDVLVIVDVSEGTTNKITKGNLLLGSGHSVELTLDPQTYQLVLKLKNAAGTELSTQSVETNIEYSNGNLIVTKQSGATSQVDISGIISGLQQEITSNNKLSSDLVDDTNQTHKFVTTSEKTTWNNKLNANKVKTSVSTTSGDVYDVTYINTIIGNVESILEELDVGGGV